MKINCLKKKLMIDFRGLNEIIGLVFLIEDLELEQVISVEILVKEDQSSTKNNDWQKQLVPFLEQQEQELKIRVMKKLLNKDLNANVCNNNNKDNNNNNKSQEKHLNKLKKETLNQPLNNNNNNKID
jgi:hypothetical protein